MKQNVKKYVIYFMVFGVFLYIGYCVPYCHDEWQWGLEERIELMKNGFRDYNGRYLGNILALIITRSIWAKALILAGGSVWLFHIMKQCTVPGISSKKNGLQETCAMLLAAFLLLAVPRTLFCQSYGWPAAFVNFVPPVILFLIYFHWTEPVYSGKSVSDSRFQIAMAVPLGFSVQLFSENITVFVVLYSIWILLVSRAKTKKWGKVPVIYLLSCMAGAILMFTNNAYRNAAADTDGYKKITFSVGAMFQQFCNKITDHLFLNNWLLDLLLAGVLLYMLAKKNRKDLLAVEMVLVFCGYATYGIFHKIYPAWVFTGNENLNDMVETGMAFLFFANVLLCIWSCMDAEEKIPVCILYLCALAVAVPLVAANPIGSRCLYAAYIFQSLVLLRLCAYVGKDFRESLFLPALILAFVTLTLSVIYVKMFKNIGDVNAARQEIIEAGIAENRTEVVLPVLPYSEYYWTTIPADESWAKRFKAFYHIPEDMGIRFE